MKIKAKITIAKTSGGAGGPTVSVTLTDDLSGISFFRGEMSLHNYAECITGLRHVEIDAEVRGLEYVGMKRVTENRTIECPLTTYKNEVLSQWLLDNAQEEGWLVNSYLGGQGQVTHRDDKTILRYHVTKYIKPEEP